MKHNLTNLNNPAFNKSAYLQAIKLLRPGAALFQKFKSFFPAIGNSIKTFGASVKGPAKAFGAGAAVGGGIGLTQSMLSNNARNNLNTNNNFNNLNNNNFNTGPNYDINRSNNQNKIINEVYKNPVMFSDVYQANLRRLS